MWLVPSASGHANVSSASGSSTASRPSSCQRYDKPAQRPSWLTAPEYDALPEAVVVREVRVRVRVPGRRVRALVLVTTLLDRRLYPAREVARVYEQQRENYRRNREEARELVRVGEAPRPANLDDGTLAAWTALGNLLLNLDETITKE